MMKLPSRILESRRGATLIEILMSLMIMSIGVVSIATLFPLALRRAVQATQMTNMQILREQVLEMVSYHPELIPINDNSIHDYSIKTAAGVTNRSLFPYGPNSPVSLWSKSEVVRIVDPLGFYEYGDLNNNGTVDAGDDFDFPADVAVIGPIDQINPRPALHDVVARAPVRVPANWNREQAAARVPLKDSWVTEGVTTFLPIARTDMNARNVLSVIQYPPQMDNFMQDIHNQLQYNEDYDFDNDSTFNEDGDASNDIEVRLMIFDENGAGVQRRKPTYIDTAARLVNLDKPLPSNELYYNLSGGNYTSTSSQVRVQSFEERYTWMLTTRTLLVGTEEVRTFMDLVIFFRRDFSIASETPHKLLYLDTQGVKNAGKFRILPDQLDKPYIVLENTTPASNIGTGDWLFHYQKARWFQVREVISEGLVDATLEGSSNADAIVAADIGKKVFQVVLNNFNSSDEEGLNPTDNSLKVTLPKGVMQVYNLGNVTQKLELQ